MKNLILEKPNNLNIITKIKLKTFSVFYKMNLKDLNYILFIFNLISNLQILSILFTKFDFWRNYYIEKFFQLIDLSIIINNLEYNTNRILIFISLFYIFLIIFTFFVIENKNNKNILFYFLKFFLSLLCLVFLIPLTNLFLRNIIFTKNYELFYFKDQLCFSNNHFPVFIFSIIGILFLILISYMYFKFFFDPRIETKKFDNRINSNFQIIKLILIIYIIYFLEIFHEDNLVLSFLLVFFIFSFFLVYNFYQKPSFYNESMNRYNFLNYLSFFISSIFLLVKYFLDIENLFIYFLFTLIFLIFLSFFIKTKNKHREILHIHYIKNPQEKISYLYNLMNLILNENKTKTIETLEFLIFNHHFYCQRKNCIFDVNNLKIDKNKDKKEIKSNLDELFKEYIEFNIDKILNDNSYLTDIKIIQIIFLIEIKKEYYEAFEMIKEIEEIIHLNLENQYILYFLKSQLIKKIFLIQNSSEKENTKNKLKSSNIINHNFKMSLEKVVYLYMEFWTLLKQDQPDFKKFIKTGNNISKMLNSIKKEAKQLNFSNKNDLELLLRYSKFLKKILSKNEKANLIIEKISEEILHNEIDSRIYITSFSEIDKIEVPTIILSSKNNKDFLIQKINPKCRKLFGYQKSEFINNNIKMIFPDNLAEYYNEKIILKNFRDGNLNNEKKKRKLNFIGIYKKNEYIFPIVLDIQFFQNLITDKSNLILYFYVIKELKDSAFLILNNNFQITNISHSCEEILGIDVFSYLKNSEINYWIKDFDRIKKNLIKNGISDIKINNCNDLNNNFQDNHFEVQCKTYKGKSIFYLLKFVLKKKSNIFINNINEDILEDFNMKKKNFLRNKKR